MTMGKRADGGVVRAAVVGQVVAGPAVGVAVAEPAVGVAVEDAGKIVDTVAVEVVLAANLNPASRQRANFHLWTSAMEPCR
jgi:hypothetical protein